MSGSESTTVLRRRLLAAVLLGAAAASVPALADDHPTAAASRGFWVAGDLHVHTIYGHDTCITPTQAWDPDSTDRAARRDCEAPYTVGFTPAQRLQEAADRGLGFVAISDHNNVVNQSDPELLAWLAEHPGFTFVPAYENSQPGHVQMLGATGCYANSGLVPGATINCDRAVVDRSAVGETALRDALRADGGVFQVNHPSDGNWPSTFGYAVVPDTVEVWNIGPWAYQHPFPASNDNDLSLQWYDGFLQRGDEVGVTGGSDTHWVTTDAGQGVGEPTTWVYVVPGDDGTLTYRNVLDGLKAHHTFVSALPPALHGPQLFLEEDRSRHGRFDAMAGDEVGPHAAFRIRTVGALPGSVLRIVTDTGSAELPLGGATTYDFTPGTDGVPAAAVFVRAELLMPDGRAVRTTACDPLVGTGTTVCRDDLAMESLTSPIFIR